MNIFSSRLSGLVFAAALLACAQSVCGGGEPSWDALPRYVPREAVAGRIRNFGFGFGGLMPIWEAGFQRFHPQVTFDDHFPTSDAAFPALVTGVTDLAPDGGEPAITETLSFFETYGYHAASIIAASGTYDVEGRSPGLVVYVHPSNPLARLTLAQLDGIFGAERTGGLDGFKWNLHAGRSALQDIRTWGQLGLTGAWAHHAIQTYGHAPSGTSRFFQLRVLHNSDKWNPNYKEYVETGSKMIADDDRTAQAGGLQHMLRDELAHDPFGIAWTIVPQASKVPGLKPIALSVGDDGPYVVPSKQSFQDRTYPLVRNLYFYFNRKPGTRLDPKLKEFLRYILSREGQEAVASNANYLPLPAEFALKQQGLLD
jgi:phosphate transport system substrate-binding protein